MKSNIRMPASFHEFSSEPIISGSDNIINPKIEAAIKGIPLFSTYPEYNFHGRIWWDEKSALWCGEVWVLGRYVTTYIAKNLKELASEMYVAHGEVHIPTSAILARLKEDG